MFKSISFGINKSLTPPAAITNTNSRLSPTSISKQLKGTLKSITLSKTARISFEFCTDQRLLGIALISLINRRRPSATVI